MKTSNLHNKVPYACKGCRNFLRNKKTVLFLKSLTLFLLSAYYFCFLAHKILFTTADLGRHIKNGEMIWLKNFAVLNANFYSYTYPQAAFLNHHWGSGVIFFLIKKWLGFGGLSLFFIILSLAAFWIFFDLARKNSSFKISALSSLLLIPLISERTDIRPEGFTYFFAGLFFWIIWNYKKKFISYGWLFILPILEILWVNTHIYFIFGFLLIGVFLFDFSAGPDEIRKIAFVLGLTIAAALINPFGLKGIVYPLGIFEDYGYRIVENQSVWFLDRLGFINKPNLLLFKIVFLALVLSFVSAVILNRRRFSPALFALALIFSGMGWLAIRNFTMFGFFILPILSINVYNTVCVLSEKKKLNSLLINVCIVTAGFIMLAGNILNNYKQFPAWKYSFGTGLVPGSNASAQFFKKLNIQGPVFNNYDIGGYLIYHLFPDERVFVDNRPEVYPASFFEDIYVPMQEDNSVWERQAKLFNFNCVYFSHLDYTPWGQKFLVERVKDNLWAPVFADSYAIIFLKRNELNKDIIAEFEIPKSYFKITESK